MVAVDSTGTDNAMYRLGEDMVVRLPRVPAAVDRLAKEHRWLPLLAPFLPLEVPRPLARGVPGEGFAWPWSVYRWVAGRDLLGAAPVRLRDAADALGGFVAALRGIDPTGAPPSFRGGPVSIRDPDVRIAVRDLGAAGIIDGPKVTQAWERTLALAQWAAEPRWLHGDLMPGNLLVRQGRLSAVIDFGGLGVGDPACDLIPAWYLFDAGSRPLFRAAAAVDDTTWARGRGWALCLGLGALHAYHRTQPALASAGRRAVLHALADDRHTG